MIKKLNKILVVLLIIILVIILVINLDKKDNTKKEIKEVKEKKVKKDVIKPEIILYGKREYRIVKNGVYEEPGFKATYKDEDITNKVKVINKLDTSKIGDQYITYKVKSSSNNETTVKRKVTIFDDFTKDTDGISVLMYHYFFDEGKEERKDSNYTSKEEFKNELNYLKENDYYFPSMKEISLYIDGKLELPDKSVVITMDDGHEDNYTIAYPLAKEFEIPIVMFVVTSWTNVNDSLQTDMRNSGYVIFQSHTHDMHRPGCSGIGHGGIIQCISKEEGVKDLNTSKEEIGNSDSVAYPFGDNTESSWEMLKESGFSLGFTTNYGRVTKNSNRYSLPRIRINGGISLDSFIKSL